MTDFDNQLKNDKSNNNELNKLLKGLTKDLINQFNIPNGPKCFSSEIFQNYLVFTPAIKYIKYFHGTTKKK